MKSMLVNELFKARKFQLMERVPNDASFLEPYMGLDDSTCFMLLLQSDEQFLLQINRNSAFSKYGDVPIVRVEVVCELDTEINIVGFVDDNTAQVSDILFEKDYMDIERKTLQPVYIQCKSSSAGKYPCTVNVYQHRMFEDESLIAAHTVEIEVIDKKVPQAKDCVFHLDLWQHLSNIARKHDVSLWSDEHFAVIEQYVKVLSELGQKAVTIIASEIPWSGQGCFEKLEYPSDLYEYSMANITKTTNGFSYDFSVMKRYIELCEKYGIKDEIEVFGLLNIWVYEHGVFGKVSEELSDAWRVRYNDNGVYKYMRTESEIKDYITALYSFFVDNGYIDKVRVLADEPADVEIYKKRLEFVQLCGDGFQFKAAVNKSDFILQFDDKIKDFVPIFNSICNDYDAFCQMKKTIRGKMFWYVCCNPAYPNNFIKSPLHETRIIPYITKWLELDGFLRWNFTVWPENPFQQLSYFSESFSSGDMNFVYPSANGTPLKSLRYMEMKRVAVEFEMLCALPQDKLDEVLDLIIKEKKLDTYFNPKRTDANELYSLTYADYNKAKRILLVHS